MNVAMANCGVNQYITEHSGEGIKSHTSWMAHYFNTYDAVITDKVDKPQLLPLLTKLPYLARSANQTFLPTQTRKSDMGSDWVQS